MDRNAIARNAFKQGLNFARKNGNGSLLVPDRLAKTGGNEQPNVGVAICSEDTVPVNFAVALGAMEYMLGRLGLGFYLFNQRGDLPAANRNSAIEAARASNCNWVLLLNQHLSFPPNALPMLLNQAYEHNLDIIGPTHARRVYPHDNLALAAPGDTATVGEVVEVAILPASFLLIRLSALEGLKRPYFRNLVIEEGEPVPELYKPLGIPDGEPRIIDDTVYFCTTMRAAGRKVWLHPALSTQMVAWNESGWKLTGTDDPNAPQFEQIELGAIATQASEAANEGKAQ
jgi:hypothetical protein